MVVAPRFPPASVPTRGWTLTLSPASAAPGRMLPPLTTFAHLALFPASCSVVTAKDGKGAKGLRVGPGAQ